MCITTAAFLEKMEKRWSSFGNVSSTALRYSWGQMCQALNDKLRASGDPEAEESWSILCPPTGSGKTQGMIVYAAMHSLPYITHPGILIVSRLKADTDTIAEQINELSKEHTGNPHLPDQAISYHSDKKGKIRMDELSDYPVLVITHEAYRISLDSLNRIEDTWEYLYNFSGGKRKLVVIDEAIDIVDYSEIQQEAVEALLFFSSDIACRFPREIKFIEELLNLFNILKNKNDNSYSEKILMDEPFTEKIKTDRLRSMLMELNVSPEEYTPPDFAPFKQALKSIPFDRKVFKNDQTENKRLYQSCLEITSAIDSMLKSFIFYSKNQSKPTFNTARLLVPPYAKGAVVFDATATSNVIYDIFDKAQIVTPPEGTRSYSNATIQFSYGHKVGKREMSKNGMKVSSSLITTLDNQFKNDKVRRKVLIVTHKGVEQFLLLPSNKSEHFDFQVAHWGAVDGSNEWQHFDTVVIFGLPYKPQRWSPSIFMAFQGVQDNLWLKDSDSRAFKHHKDIRKAIDRGQMIADIIQAINRVRCRRVIDDLGNCPATDIFLLLPDAQEESQELFAGICKAMPEVNTELWQYEHQKTKRRGRLNSIPSAAYDDSLIAHLSCLSDGDRVSATSVKNTLAIKGGSWDRLADRLKANDPDDPLTQRLQDIKVIYQNSGKGKTTHFIKVI